MNGPMSSRKLLILAALTVVVIAPAVSRQCLAETLPRPAARFIHFFEQSSAAEKVGEGRVGVWERFVYSLILATSTPTEGKTTTSSSARPS